MNHPPEIASILLCPSHSHNPSIMRDFSSSNHRITELSNQITTRFQIAAKTAHHFLTAAEYL